jgi:EAL domain-containing protein (putative c-di-GMP-specific phosphodiesterase class I)
MVVGYESLVRFPLEIGLAPDVCFHMAATCGRRVDLEECVLRRGFEAVPDLPRNCFLSINVSPEFLISARWDAVLEDLPSLARVVVEITEQDLIDDYDRVRHKLAAIRARGGTIAIDDTGSGFASLKHVMELKPNFVKLDRFFVGGCHYERAKATLIEMMGTATNRLDAWVIAEGVETPDELDELILLGVPLAQGYYLGRPEPAMNPLSPARADDLRARIHTRTLNQTLLRHLDACPACPTQAAAEDHLRMSAAAFAMVVDQWNRPVELLHYNARCGTHALSPLMKVQLSCDPVEALQRALTRPAPAQFDPFAVIDEFGAFQGIVRLDRLMHALLENRPPPESQPQPN